MFLIFYSLCCCCVFMELLTSATSIPICTYTCLRCGASLKYTCPLVNQSFIRFKTLSILGSGGAH